MKEILNSKNKEYAKKCIENAMNLGFEFKLNNKFKMKEYKRDNFEDLLKKPNKGTELLELEKYFKDEIMPYCSNFANEKFMGFPDAGNSIAGISGAILADFMQQNLINPSFCAPIGTYMEIAVIKWFRELLGYKINKINSIWDVGGIITYGGTGSNASAMLLAREHHKKNTMSSGVTNPKDFKVIIPKGIGHYSIRSSSMWIGCGDNIIEVPTNEFKYDLIELRKIIRENKGKIMAVVAYAGDSRTMAIDNFEEIYRIVKEEDPSIWLHADACHGFSLAFSDKLKYKIRGIEKFDSISTDPHKVLNIPYCVSAMLVKDPENLKLFSSSSDLIMQEDFALGQITPFIGSKSWVSLKIWFAMKNIGIKNIGKIIEKRHKIALTFEKMLNETLDFKVINNVNINSVVFMYTGNKKYSVEKLNALNEKIHEKLLSNGDFHLHKFSLPDDKGILKKGEILKPLRFMSGNPNLKKKDLIDLLNEIRKIAKGVDF